MINALSTRVSYHSYYSVPCSYNVNFQMDLSIIKNDLNNNKPFVATLKCLPELANGTCKQCSDSSHYGQWIYVRNARTSPSGDITTGHTVAIVGYDDSVWCDVNENNVIDTGETGAFKIANSWGTGFCNSGYAWVLYDALLATSRIKSANNSSVTWDHSYSTVRYPFFTYDDTDYYTNTFYYCSISDYTVGYISELTLSTNRRNQLKAWSAYKYSSAAYTNDIPIYSKEILTLILVFLALLFSIIQAQAILQLT